MSSTNDDLPYVPGSKRQQSDSKNEDSDHYRKYSFNRANIRLQPENQMLDCHSLRSSNIDIYSDPCEAMAPGRTTTNPTLTKLATYNNLKRNPLTTVSNNNLLPNPETIFSAKIVNLVAEDNFFLYKKELPEHPPQPCYFQHLSDEMVLSIFKWLPKKTLIRCSLVSKQFHRVAQDESLWTRLDLGSKYLKKEALSSILSRNVVILRLSQTQISDPIFDSQKPIFDIRLQYLDLSMSLITKPSLLLLLSRCRHLIKLSLEHVPIDTEICIEISENKSLEALNLTMCEDVTAQGLLTICKELQYLKSINISWTTLNSKCVKVFVENITENILQLNVAGCRKSMNNQAVLTLIERCPDLLELDLSDCTSLTSAALASICKLKKLEYLSLSRCYNININNYFSLNDLKSLLYLDVFGVMNEQATQMLQNHLKHVGINKFIHSSVARPTVGTRRTSIWGLRTRD